MDRQRTSSCTHRWVLGEPTLTSVPGVCRRCGARRAYPAGLGFHEALVDHEELDHRRLRVAIDAAAPVEQSVAIDA
jgi:hypothetical protein